MNHLLYLAGAIAFLFGFFYFADRTEETGSFVYLQYACLIMSFWFLTLGIKYWSEGRPKSLNYRERSDARRKKWYDQRKSRRERRRY